MTKLLISKGNVPAANEDLVFGLDTACARTATVPAVCAVHHSRNPQIIYHWGFNLLITARAVTFSLWPQIYIVSRTAHIGFRSVN